MHEASAPPSPPPPAPHGPPSIHDGDEEDTGVIARRALRISLANREAIGRAPNGALRNDRGSGFWQLFVETQAQITALEQSVNEKLDAINTTVSNVLKRLDDDAEKTAKRSGWAARIGWKVVDVLVPAAVLAAIAYLAGFHR